MNKTPPAAAAAIAADATRAGEGQMDRPRLVRWAHLCTVLGFFVFGLSIVGIVLASMAVKRGEYGAQTVLRNAVAVTLFLILFGLAIVLVASSI